MISMNKRTPPPLVLVFTQPDSVIAPPALSAELRIVWVILALPTALPVKIKAQFPLLLTGMLGAGLSHFTPSPTKPLPFQSTGSLPFFSSKPPLFSSDDEVGISWKL